MKPQEIQAATMAQGYAFAEASRELFSKPSVYVLWLILLAGGATFGPPAVGAICVGLSAFITAARYYRGPA